MRLRSPILVLRDRNRLVLQWMPVRRESTASAGGPTGSIRLHPYDVVDEIEAFIDEDSMEIERNRYSLRRFVSTRSSNEDRRCVQNEEPAFVENAAALMDYFFHLQEVFFVLDVVRIFRPRIVVRRRREDEVNGFRRSSRQQVLAVSQSNRISQVRNLRRAVSAPCFGFSIFTAKQPGLQDAFFRCLLFLHEARIGVDYDFSYLAAAPVQQRNPPDVVTVVHFGKPETDGVFKVHTFQVTSRNCLGGFHVLHSIFPTFIYACCSGHGVSRS